MALRSSAHLTANQVEAGRDGKYAALESTKIRIYNQNVNPHRHGDEYEPTEATKSIILMDYSDLWIIFTKNKEEHFCVFHDSAQMQLKLNSVQ